VINSIRTLTIVVLTLFCITAYAQTTKVVVIPLGDSPFNYAKFSGPQRDLKQSLLEDEGWEVCHTSVFGSGSSALGSILYGTCRIGAELMLACRPIEQVGGYFTLAAYAPREDVTFNTGYNNIYTTHTANGSEWYYDSDQSWGFAPEGASVYKNPCDFGVQEEKDYRMCMHTDKGDLDQGFRCGDDANSLQISTTWERVILQR